MQCLRSRLRQREIVVYNYDLLQHSFLAHDLVSPANTSQLSEDTTDFNIHPRKKHFIDLNFFAVRAETPQSPFETHLIL